MEKEQIKKAYQEILEVASKYEKLGKIYEYNDIEKIIEKAKNHLLIIEWSEKYGLNLKHDIQIYGRDYFKINEDLHFSYFKDAQEEHKKGSGRFISWSDGGKQPKNEWLLDISFSTGAYIFGDDYPTKIFEEFWQELKTYNPKYCDSHNNNMYFSIESASKIFNEYDTILKKYREKNKEDFKLRKIEKLKDELEKLEDLSVK